MAEENCCKAIPVYRVEGLMEIELKDYGRNIPFEAVVKKICGIGKVFSNASSLDETSLVTTNQRGDERLQAISQNFRNGLNNTVLKSNRAKVCRATCNILFGIRTM